jgi:hypothetical protein
VGGAGLSVNTAAAAGGNEEGTGGRGLPSPYKLGFGNSFQLGHITPDITPEHSSGSRGSTSTASNLSEQDAADLDKEVPAAEAADQSTAPAAGFDQSKAPVVGFDQSKAPVAGFDQTKAAPPGFDKPPTSNSSSGSAGGGKSESAKGVASATAAAYESPAAGLNQQAAQQYAAAASSSSSRGTYSKDHSIQQQQQLLSPEAPVLLDASALDHMGSSLTEDQVVLQPEGLLLAGTGAGTGPKGSVTSSDTRVTPSIGISKGSTAGTGFPGFASSTSAAPSLGSELAALGEVHTGLHQMTLQEAVGEVTSAAEAAAASDTFDAEDLLQQREVVVDGAEKEEAGDVSGSAQPTARQEAVKAAGLTSSATDIPPAESASSIELLSGSPLIDMMSNALALGLTSEEDLSSEQPGRVARAVHKHYSSGKSSSAAESAAAAAVAAVEGAPAAGAYGTSIDLVPAASAPSSLPPTTGTGGSNPVRGAAAGRLPVLSESASSPAVLQDTSSSGGVSGMGRPEAPVHGPSHTAAAAAVPMSATAGSKGLQGGKHTVADSAAARADSAGLQSGTFFRAESGVVGSWPSGPAVEEELQQLDQLLSGTNLLQSS